MQVLSQIGRVFGPLQPLTWKLPSPMNDSRRLPSAAAARLYPSVAPTDQPMLQELKRTQHSHKTEVHTHTHTVRRLVAEGHPQVSPNSNRSSYKFSFLAAQELRRTQL